LSFQRKLELLISKIIVIPATAESQKLLSFQRKLKLLISKIVVIPAEAGTPHLQNCCHPSGSWNSSGKVYFTRCGVSLEGIARK
jgi:hypothetical protein